MTALVWFRRDLRLHDHPALHAALADHDVVIPVFCLDERLLRGRYASAPRTAFMLATVRELADALRERGSGLVIRDSPPERSIPELAREAGADAVFWTSDVGPFARARDRRITAALDEHGIAARPHGGNYVVDVSVPRTRAGKPFGVFSPFFRAWAQTERRTVHRAPTEMPALPSGVAVGRLPALQRLADGDDVPAPITAAGETAARAALEHWLNGPIDRYHDAQDAIGADATSALSPHLRWGTLSALECEQRAGRRGGKGAAAWIRQLCWRDFYAHVLLTNPENTTREHQARYRGMRWAGDDALLTAWQEGQTGYPLVDAGMRQLAATGWMHNRVRLVVGSFLTKDLHQDWRAGEVWFARLLLDAEPAQNNGNWQWIASVGTDPAPLFRRLYNPARHQERYDPDGTYVRRWVPELARVPDARLAEPWLMTDDEQREAGCVIGEDYPAPVVDHKHEREVAMERYRSAAG